MATRARRSGRPVACGATERTGRSPVRRAGCSVSARCRASPVTRNGISCGDWMTSHWRSRRGSAMNGGPWSASTRMANRSSASATTRDAPGRGCTATWPSCACSGATRCSAPRRTRRTTTRWSRRAQTPRSRPQLLPPSRRSLPPGGRGRAMRNVPAARRQLLMQLVVSILCPHCHQRLPVPTLATVRCRHHPSPP